MCTTKLVQTNMGTLMALAFLFLQSNSKTLSLRFKRLAANMNLFLKSQI